MQNFSIIGSQQRNLWNKWDNKCEQNDHVISNWDLEVLRMLSPTVLEHSAVNRVVVGSSPTEGVVRATELIFCSLFHIP